MLDRVGDRRQPGRPLAVRERRKAPRQPMPAAGDLARLDLHPAGLNAREMRFAVQLAAGVTAGRRGQDGCRQMRSGI